MSYHNARLYCLDCCQFYKNLSEIDAVWSKFDADATVLTICQIVLESATEKRRGKRSEKIAKNIGGTLFTTGQIKNLALEAASFLI